MRMSITCQICVLALFLAACGGGGADLAPSESPLATAEPPAEPAEPVLFLASGAATAPRSTYSLLDAAYPKLDVLWEDAQPAVFRGMTYDPATGQVFASTGSELYTVELDTGITTQIGSHGVAGLRGLAAVGDELIMGHGTTNVLYSVDRITGLATEIGNLPSRNKGCFALDTDPVTGALYAVLATDSVYLRSLWTIDLADPISGSVHISFLHRKPTPSLTENLLNVSGMAFLPDGLLYIVGDETGLRPSDHNTLWVADPATARCTIFLELSTVEEGESMAVVPSTIVR